VTWSSVGTSNFSGAGVAALAAGAFYGSGQSLSADAIKAALYGNTPTPNKNDTLANNAYNGGTGQWLTANETTGTGYTATGATLVSPTCTNSSGVVTLTSTGPSWSGATFTAYGTLVYDSSVTGKYAYCWNYFGAAESVTSGTFTVAWNASGIGTITIS
jgi:hypothetical protein